MNGRRCTRRTYSRPSVKPPAPRCRRFKPQTTPAARMSNVPQRGRLRSWKSNGTAFVGRFDVFTRAGPAVPALFTRHVQDGFDHARFGFGVAGEVGDQVVEVGVVG